MLAFVLVHDFLFTSARSNQHHYLYPHDQHRFISLWAYNATFVGLHSLNSSYIYVYFKPLEFGIHYL